jgi:hypothetical protein
MDRKLRGEIVTIRGQSDCDAFGLSETDPENEDVYLDDSPPWGEGKWGPEIYLAERCGLHWCEYIRSRQLARLLPGEETDDPRDKLWPFLIAKYNLRPETLRGMTAREMSMYVKAGLEPPSGTRTAEEQAQAGRTTPSSAAHESPCLKTVRHPPKTEARNAWLYEEACKEDRPKWQSLMIQLNRVAENRGWTKLGSVQGVQQAVNRYADANNLPRPAPRKQS